MKETVENKRPIVLTIICVLIIIGAIFAPLSLYFVMSDPVAMELLEKVSKIPMSVQYILIMIGSIIGLLTAVGMLKGKKIARTVYVGYSIFGLILNLFISNMKASLITTTVFSIVILGLLYLPNINRYFDRENA